MGYLWYDGGTSSLRWGRIGYLGVQLLWGLERFPWYGTGTSGWNVTGWGVEGECRDCSRVQAGGWGLLGEKNPPWKQIGVNFGEMQLKGEQREVHVQICV